MFEVKTKINDSGDGTVRAADLTLKNKSIATMNTNKKKESNSEVDLMSITGAGNIISIEDLSRITGLSAYKLRNLIREGRLPFASYIEPGAGRERGSFIISLSGFKRWVDEDLTGGAGDLIKQRIREFNTLSRDIVKTTPYTAGEAKENLMKVVVEAKKNKRKPPEFILIFEAIKNNNKDDLYEKVAELVEEQVQKYLSKYDVPICNVTPSND